MMKKHVLLQKLVRASSAVLPAVALFFAASPCIAKLYEPELPKQLQK